jgi:ABC-type glycerol-3-phosphate transport system substrate-binding protein
MRPSKRPGLCLLLLICCLAALAAAGCKRGPSSGVTEITVWSGWTGDEQAAFEELVADFNRALVRGITMTGLRP